MHTMHVQPGRWRGCLVVVAIDGVVGFPSSPSTAAVASASSPDASRSSEGLKLPAILRFLKSVCRQNDESTVREYR